MIPRNPKSLKISGKRNALIFASVTLLSFFARYAEGVSIGPPSRKYPTVDAPRCAKALQLHPRKVSDIKGGKKIEFAWRDTRYWIEVRNEKGEEGENPVEWSNHSSDADTPGLAKIAPVMGTIRIDEGKPFFISIRPGTEKLL
ncbi:MAG: hypothetical protein IPJ71_00300 [Bdellovibrionales bacterium]|nr:hypothetical protein [Bdellovibrionales bacterium]